MNGESPTLTSADWLALTEGFTRAGESFVFGNPQVDSDLARAEAVRSMTRYFASACLLLLEGDPSRPRLVRSVSPWLNQFMPTPDAGYLSSVVHGDHEYRIAGRRGSATILQIESYRGDWSNPWGINSVGCCDLSGLEPDEEFEVVLTRDRRKGCWIGLPESLGIVLVRQYYYDWEREHPATLAIERVDAEHPLPAPSFEMLRESIGRLIVGIEAMPSAVNQMAELFFDADTTKIPFPPLRLGGDRDYETQAAFTGMYYGQGRYHCELDEAVILDVKPPACRYWGFHLTNAFMEAPDYGWRQISVNGRQASVDDDGGVRLVISHEDPGVPNWLDAGGVLTGLVAGRYFEPDSVPIPSLQVVAVSSLRDVLPEGTPFVSKAERSDILSRRLRAATGKMWE